MKALIFTRDKLIKIRHDERERMEYLIALMTEGTILPKQRIELEQLLAKDQGRSW